MHRRKFLRTGLGTTLALASDRASARSSRETPASKLGKRTGSGMSAYFGDYTYSGSTTPALVVELGKPWKFVCWADAQYVPFWDIDGVWVTTEWFETLGTKTPYDFEPISDKKLRYTSVEILEIGPARAVVHWRYALCDTRPEARIFHDNTTAEEFHTIYPDGVTVRKVVGYPGNGEPREGQPKMWEVGELLLVLPQGSQLLEVLGQDGVKISNIAGDSYQHRFSSYAVATIDFEQPNLADSIRRLCQVHPPSREWTEFIWQGGLRDRPEPFVVVPNKQEWFPHARCRTCGGDHPETSLVQWLAIWKHFPQWSGDEYHIGIPATEADLARRSVSLSYLFVDPWVHPVAASNPSPSLPFDPQWNPPRGTTWLLLYGVNPGDTDHPRRLAASWLHPGEVKTLAGRYLGYEPAERAYRFQATGYRVDFELAPAPGLGQINPVVVVEDWAYGNPKISLGRGELPVGSYKASRARNRLVVWFEAEIKNLTPISIEGRTEAPVL